MSDDYTFRMMLVLVVTVPMAVLVTSIEAVAGRPLRTILKHGAIGAAVLTPVFGAIIGGAPTPAFEIPGLVFEYAQGDRVSAPCWAGFGLGLVGVFLTTPLSMFGAAFLGFASPLLSGLLQIALPIGVFVLIFIKVCTGAPTRGRRQG